MCQEKVASEFELQSHYCIHFRAWIKLWTRLSNIYGLNVLDCPRKIDLV